MVVVGAGVPISPILITTGCNKDLLCSMAEYNSLLKGKHIALMGDTLPQHTHTHTHTHTLEM